MTTGDGQDPQQPDGEASRETPRGRMSFQDETTTPREPTLAERRAREQHTKRIAQAQQAREAEQASAARRTKRILVGSGVAVGVVGVIALGYLIARPGETTEARCVDSETGVVVDDANCATPADNNQASAGVGGFVPFPIFLGGGGRQYNYNYGGAGNVGETVRGGTTTVPPGNQRVATPSGRVLSGGSSSGRSSVGNNSSTSRGGFGVSGRSSSGS